MNNSVQLRSGVWQATRYEAKALTRINSGCNIATARTEAAGEVQVAKIDVMSGVTQRGLQGVAFLTQVEQQLAQVVPLAASRLQAIADIGTLGLTEIVMDTANDLRQIKP